MPPFSSYVALSNGSDTHEVASVTEAPFELSAEWRSGTDLVIHVNCPEDPRAACLPSEGRHWSVGGEPKWRDVHITYEIDSRLLRTADSATIARLRALTDR